MSLGVTFPSSVGDRLNVGEETVTKQINGELEAAYWSKRFVKSQKFTRT